MTKHSLSVLVLTYRPRMDALFSTLRSIVMQKDCDFELIVADDGSASFCPDEVRSFLDAQGFSRYQIVTHEKNVGTVQNLLDGVKAASGTYIKPISPGDYLYDDTTLRDIVAFMEQYGAKAAFGQMVFYACDPKLQVMNMVYPYLAGIYRADRANYPYRKAMKQQIVFNDFICGASAVYEKEAFLNALQTISPAVRYTEDTVFQLFALQNTRIYAIPRQIVWYEYGSGISTRKTSQVFTRVDEDFYKFYFLLSEQFPKNAYIKRACTVWQLRKSENRGKLLLYKLLPDKVLFSLRLRFRRKTMKTPQYSDEFFCQCHKPADGN